MSDTVDEARDSALDKAARTTAAVSGGARAAVGDLPGFLRAYYRYAATEDLAPFGREQIAAVAVEQAALAGERPQGRALVGVRGRRPGRAAIAALGRPVIDIVTDDMPYLVDSVLMELARHGLAIQKVIHPQLRVRRDVSGRLHEVLGPCPTGRRPRTTRSPRGSTWKSAR